MKEWGDAKQRDFTITSFAFSHRFSMFSFVFMYLSDSESHLVVSDSLRPHGLSAARLLCPWSSPGQNPGVGSLTLLQGIFPNQGWNPGLLHCRQILYHLSPTMSKLINVFVILPEIEFQQSLFKCPGGSEGKDSACSAGDLGSIPGSRRSRGGGHGNPLQYSWACLAAQLVKNPPAVRETWVPSLGGEDPLEEGLATRSSTLGWRSPWREEPGTTVHGVAKSRTRQ